MKMNRARGCLNAFIPRETANPFVSAFPRRGSHLELCVPSPTDAARSAEREPNNVLPLSRASGRDSGFVFLLYCLVIFINSNRDF